MDDVIFAGTSGRPPLGRAEVILTIDNSDGALPIEYAEVTISRTMFRSGGSEYAINGTTCRLLDVQELLSDSGIGREMHVIVGQGQLDTILHATPEDRRGFIEEAAGVLKHRKRKEKALRKLDACDGNLTRLNDLLGEIRRQLKPLGRQAEVARRAAGVQATVRDARARVMADDLVTARTALDQELADESLLVARQQEVEAQSQAARDKEARLEAALREDLPALAKAQETWFAIAGVKERIRGTQSLAIERVRNAQATVESTSTPGRDPEQLEVEAAELKAQEEQIVDEVAARRAALDETIAARHEAENAAAEEERRVAGLERAAADRREGLARLHGQVNAARSRAAAAADEIGRLEQAREEALARAGRAQHDFTSLETRVAGLDAGEEGLDAEHEAAASILGDLEDRLAKVRDEALRADRDRILADRPRRRARARPGPQGRRRRAARRLRRRLRAARLGGRPAHRPRRLRDRGRQRPGCGRRRGRRRGCGRGRRRDRPPQDRRPRPRRPGRRRRLRPPADRATWPTLPAEASYAVDAVECPDVVRPALTHLLDRVAVVGDLTAARQLVALQPELTAVTLEGDVLGAHVAAGGSSSQPSLLEIQAAVDEASRQLAEAIASSERLSFDIARLEHEAAEARQRVDVALAKLHESDATLAAVAEELGQFGSQVRSARGEADRLTKAIQEAEAAREQDQSGLAELEGRLARAETDPAAEPELDAREQLVDAGRGVPHGRDRGAAGAADLRGARPRPARPRRPADARGAGRARDPRPRDRASRAGRPRGSQRRGRRCWAPASC